MTKKKALLLILSTRSRNKRDGLLARITGTLLDNERFKAEVLLIDASQSPPPAFNGPLTVLSVPASYGCGAQQKLGCQFALSHGFDAVAVLHPDRDHPPEYLEKLLGPVLNDEADAVVGSRLLSLLRILPLSEELRGRGAALFNRLTFHAFVPVFFTSFRAYGARALEGIPFLFNSDRADFDIDILIQLLDTKKTVAEVAVPLKNTLNVIRSIRYLTSICVSRSVSLIQHWGILYHPKFDYRQGNSIYTPKFGYRSSHQFAADRVQHGATVIDLGCGPGFMARELAKKNARTISVDACISCRRRGSARSKASRRISKTTISRRTARRPTRYSSSTSLNT